MTAMNKCEVCGVVIGLGFHSCIDVLLFEGKWSRFKAKAVRKLYIDALNEADKHRRNWKHFASILETMKDLARKEYPALSEFIARVESGVVR